MPESHDERRVVTALFADVAGSTALSERLDPEEAKIVIQEAIGRAIRAVETYGGTVNNLMGDGLLALFGAPVAHEDDPERAVRAGLDIVAAARDYADEVRRGWGVEDFAMRVGIHTGEVVTGQVGAGGRVEYGVVGDTVNTAARLEAAADRNGVLVSEQAQRQVRARFNWGEVRSLELKGKADPVTAYPAHSLRESSGRATTQAPTSQMVGRDAEMSSAMQLLDRLGSGRGGVLFIVGEPGIGKSRLAAELRQQAISKQCPWLEGRCVSYGESLPYWPYRDLLRNWLEVSPTENDLRVRVKLRRKTDEAYGGQGGEAYPYLATVMGLNLEPEVAAQMRALSPESMQYRTFEVVQELLQRVATIHPLVVSLDDLHWADATSLALTERLLALTETAPIMLVISQRPETEHASWLLKEKAAREYRHLFRELALQPLGHDSETRLLTSLAEGRALPAPVSERLLAYAEGNPFYLEQILRSLIDGGTLIPENGHWTLKASETLEIPQTLEGVIIARIDRLEPQWREVLTSASVLGRTFGLGLLEAATGLPAATLRQAVHHLLRLDLFREEGAAAQPVYRFKHALIQEAAYHTLVGPRRAALHRRAAEWFESYYKDRPERVYGLIAHHWLGTDDQEKAAHFLKLAGDRALAEWAVDEAAGHFRALVPLLEKAGRSQEAAETLFQLATTLHLAMRFREANETWQRAFDRWTPPNLPATVPTAALKISAPVVPWHTDPAQALHTPNLMLHLQLYQSLLKGRPGPSVLPGLAARWEVSDDGRRYRMHLDPRAEWNEGGAIRAQDLMEGYRTLLDPKVHSTAAAHLAPLENAAAYVAGEIDDFDRVGVHALDDRTLEFRLHSPTPSWIFSLVVTGHSGAVNGRLSGPFRVTRFLENGAVIERDLRHKDQRGNVATVEWIRQTRDEQLESILRKEVDVVTPIILTPDADAAINDGRLTTFVTPPIMTSYLAFSGAAATAPDIHLRRALAHATDRGVLAGFLAANQLAAHGGLVPPGLPGHTPDCVLPFDPELARACLQRSSHRGPLRITMPVSWALPYIESVIDIWRTNLDLEIERVKIAVQDLFAGTLAGHADLGIWIAGYPDPEYYLHMLLHSRSSSNMSRWSSPAFDALIDRANSQENGAARLALFHEADRMAVQQECSVLPLVYTRVGALLQPWVHGWWAWGVPWMGFDELTIDERSP
ncbi:MAG: ABC transporter substrate-binding protein, partial [Candidatus Dormibacteraeota bacterium]|nr:ABC transporter substrate-binding protein [Candidatus Dormibacteraeota bacterium]